MPVDALSAPSLVAAAVARYPGHEAWSGDVAALRRALAGATATRERA
jgi:hypothetical protein